MKSVFITITILNDYKNIDMVFANREDAENRKKELSEDYRFCLHEIYVCEYNVN